MFKWFSRRIFHATNQAVGAAARLVSTFRDKLWTELWPVGFYFSKCCSASTLFTAGSLTRGRVMPQWHCMQRDKIRLNPLEVQGEEKKKKPLMLFPGEGFHFCVSSQGAYTFIFPATLSVHIFFNPPADTSAHVPGAPRSLLCGHQSYSAQLRGLAFSSTHFLPRNWVSVAGPLRLVPIQTTVFSGRGPPSVACIYDTDKDCSARFSLHSGQNFLMRDHF